MNEEYPNSHWFYVVILCVIPVFMLAYGILTSPIVVLLIPVWFVGATLIIKKYTAWRK